MMNRQQMFDEIKTMSDVHVLAGLFYGEARIVEDTHIDDVKEYLAIGNTVLNRVALSRFPDTVKDVILQPRQFSCFNLDDPNLEHIYSFLINYSPLFNKMSLYADMVLKKQTRDFSCGADHYVALWLYERRKGYGTHWMYKMKITSIYGGHIFLKEKA